MTDSQPDPLASMLAPLCAEQWVGRDHQERLRARLEGMPPPRSRWTLPLLTVACGALLSVLLAATGGLPYVLRWFGVEVVDVQRDAAGQIERITLRMDDATELQLQPVRPDLDLGPGVEVVVPDSEGGELHLRVLRDKGLELLPTFVPVEGPAHEPRTGERFAVRAAPCPYRATRTETALVLVATTVERRIELPRIPTPAGTLPRYGDDRALVEILTP